MIFILAEKPNNAEFIAKNRGATENFSTAKKDGYFKGKGYFVSWAFGHIMRLAEPEDYNPEYAHWRLEDLPFMPDNFKILPQEKFTKHLALIKDLMQRADKVINACDSDREGESIFWEIMLSVKHDISRFYRLWFSNLSDDELNKSFGNLKPLNDYKGLYQAAYARQILDLLYGINFSRLATLHSASGLWTIGRVQTPTLALVCEAWEKNKNFIPTPYWKIKVYSKNNEDFVLTGGTDFEDENKANAALMALGKNIVCDVTDMELKKEAAPKLFNADTLVIEASKKFNFLPEKTAAIVQRLYDVHRVITYGRTVSEYLKEDDRTNVTKSMHEFLSSVSLRAYHEDISNLSAAPLPSKIFNDKKVESHGAIIPNGNKIDALNLSDEETDVYLMIFNRFISAMLPDCDYELYKYDFSDDNNVETFKYSFRKVLNEGWKKYNFTDNDDQDKVLENRYMDFVEGKQYPILKKELFSLMTKKPPLLTVATLIKLMLNAGRSVEDKEQKEILKKTGGLGTGATRPEIVKTLFTRKYIELKEKNLVPTENGIRLYNAIKNTEVGTPVLTANFEFLFDEIEQGREKFSKVYFFAKENVNKLFDDEHLINGFKGLANAENEKMDTGLCCPNCGGAVLLGKYYICSNNQPVLDTQTNTWSNNGTCGFLIKEKVLNKKITPDILKQLIETGKTKKEVKGFINDGKKFNANLMLSKDENSNRFLIKFSFDDFAIKCPKCKGKLINTDKNIFCFDKENCGFVFFKTIAGKKITESAIALLLEQGATNVIKGFTSKQGKFFDAKIVLNKMFKTEFLFDKKK